MKHQSIHHQQGAALAVGLILLLIITLMGYAGMKGTMLQEKMAAGLHNKSLAHSGANSAVRAGETYLYNLVSQTNGVNVEGTPAGSLFNIYSHYQTPKNAASGLNTVVEKFKERNLSSTAGTAHSHNFTSSSYNGALSNQPQFIIEELQSVISGGGEGSQEFASGAGGGSDGSVQKAFLVTGKSTSGDGNTILMNQSMYTVVVDSSPTN